MSNKYIVCPDSFKGSVSAAEAANAIKEGILQCVPDAKIVIIPIADGGEGTLDAIVPKEMRIRKNVCGSAFCPVSAEYGYTGDTAVIEMAAAAGITLVPKGKRNPENYTTYGVGELIFDALDRGFDDILITVGGSGTNDGGAGMLSALGARFYDGEGNPLTMCGAALGSVENIDITGLDKRLYSTKITFACDVTNPLTGESGATYMYGPQKGAGKETLAVLEAGMNNYAKKLADISKDVRFVPGCGAGGGIATPLVAIFGAEIKSGINSVLAAVSFESQLEDAVLVITGEGRVDAQSAFGKAISGVAAVSKKYNVPVLVLAGTLGDGADVMYSAGVTKMSALTGIAPTKDYAIKNAAELLRMLAAQEIRAFLEKHD